MRYRCIHLLLLLILSCCKEEHKTTVPVITNVASPAGEGSALPFLFSDGENTLMSWVEKVGDSLAILKYSKLDGHSWQPPKEVLRGTDWFVNWADFPVIAENAGNLFTHVLKKSSAGTYSYDVKYNLFSRDEQNWQANLPLHIDGTPTEHGFVTALPYKEGFFTTWLDGRNTLENEAGERGAMTIRAAEISMNGEVRANKVLDTSTCDCCQTTAAITSNGPVVLYRDRSKDEVRDISIVRRVEGEWTAPKTVFNDNWKINGCPVNGPKASAINNTLAVAWFTAARDSVKVQLAFSADGGANFDQPLLVSDAGAMGRVDVALLDGNSAVVSWMETNESGAALKIMKVHRAGKSSGVHTIAQMNASRGSGFPQMERVGERLYFAWTAIEGKSSVVKTAYVSVASL